MPSQLGKYTLVRTLGSGANSKVKLGLDKSTGRYFAVKILKKGNPNLDAKFLELVMTEVHTMTSLSHPNIVNLIEYNKDGIVEKANGDKEPVIYIVLELATGGELFDYVATTGRFSEPIARFYFRQLIDGLDYVHQQGVTHRDLKPENVLYDQLFNLKIADFGFAAPLNGRDGHGYCKTKLGTESYMAPEIHAKKPYLGASVDLFASAIILFIMITQHPPFSKAEPTDPFYRLICANRADLFWKAHSKNKPEGFFTEEFKNLITSMLQFDPTHRLSMTEVKTHPWMQGECATLEGIQQEFAERKANIDAENEAKRQQKEAEKAQKQGGFAAQRRAYRGVHRGEGDEEDEGTNTAKRICEEYVRMVNKNTELFSTFDADTLLGTLEEFADKQGFKYLVAKDKYKIKLELTAEKEDEKVQLTAKILRVNPEKYCIEFNRTSGDSIMFYNHFNTIRDYYGDLINTAY